MRRAARRDANEAALLSCIEPLGGLWLPHGPLDGWLGFRGVFHLCEVKDPKKQGRAREFTPEQIRLLARLRECHLPYHVLRTEADLLGLLGARVSA